MSNAMHLRENLMGGFDAASQSFSEANKGFQVVAVEMTDYAKKAFDDAMRNLGATHRRVEEALEIQSQYAKRVYKNHMAELSKLAEMYTAMASLSATSSRVRRLGRRNALVAAGEQQAGG
jgi:hypothetical protein